MSHTSPTQLPSGEAPGRSTHSDRRSARYDVLRVSACLAVILLHLSATIVLDPEFIWSAGWYVSVMVDAATRWCVVGFIMLSGALILNPEKHVRPNEFWTKRAHRLLPALIVWPAIYLAWRYLFWKEPLTPALIVYDLLAGRPYIHLYFLFLIAGLYLVTPLLATIVSRLSSAQLREAILIIGFLAGLGVTEVKVWAQPKVFRLVTGNELAPPGTPLLHGQVYESNSFALIAALHAMNIQPTAVHRCKDDEQLITAHLAQGIEQCDLVIVTGGISVGDYDLVKKSMDHCGVETVFYKVKQKPGKPLFFGKKNHVLLFGLPGNPAAVLTCFYEYIAPAIEKMTGKTGPSQRLTHKTLAESFTKRAGLTYFLKGKIQGSEVLPLHAQESYQMSSFALADCLIVLEEDKTICDQGETVEVHLFPKW